MEKTNAPQEVLSKNAFRPEQRKVICPSCKNDDCYRIPRGVIVKQVFSVIPLRRYFCAKCINRFYKFS